jgi:hypothetical protein
MAKFFFFQNLAIFQKIRSMAKEYSLLYIFLDLGKTLHPKKMLIHIDCRNPLWGKCEDEIHTPKNGNLESSETLENSELDFRGQTPRIEMFFISLKRFWSVDVQNGLAWAIWTSTTQVMVKRRAGSQIGSLTPDH